MEQAKLVSAWNRKKPQQCEALDGFLCKATPQADSECQRGINPDLVKFMFDLEKNRDRCNPSDGFLC
jgi:hypothetical protein